MDVGTQRGEGADSSVQEIGAEFGWDNGVEGGAMADK